MNAVRAGSERDVGAVADEQNGLGVFCNFGGFRSQFKQ
jgi:hypothetical protein